MNCNFLKPLLSYLTEYAANVNFPVKDFRSFHELQTPNTKLGESDRLLTGWLNEAQ